VNCPNCQSENPHGARFCANCGTQLPLTCRNCGTELQPEARFCHNCGHPVADGPASAQPTGASLSTPSVPDQLIRRYLPKQLLAKLESARSSSLMSGERRVVTNLFCDVHESTTAAAHLDPEEWAEIINGAFEHMIQPIYQYEGTVARLQGDGILAFFGAPVAHEDDPERAVLAGLEIIRKIQPYSEQVKRQWDINLTVRVGINTGLVVVGEVGSDLRVEYTALGDAINLAARMEQNAEPGTVLVAESTYRLIAPLFDIEVIEGLAVKGYSKPLTAYRPIRRKEQPGSLRGLLGLSSPLIGRQEQMQALWSAIEGLNQGQGKIVSVIGEAGLGKSRLVHDFARDLQATQPSTQWLEGRTRSYQSSLPFAPFIDLFSRFFNLRSDSNGASAYPHILTRLQPLFGADSNDVAPYFAHLSGVPLDDETAERIKYIPPQRLRATIFSHITALLENMLAAGPVVLYLDDLHWCDPTSLELLQSLLPLTKRSPLMVLTAFRPLQREPSWQYHLQARQVYSDRYHELNLAPLSETQSRQLVSSLLKIDDLPEKIRLKMMEKSEGNPLFVEEVIRSLLDDGLIVQENGRWRATAEIDHISLPDTLIGVITARLDRLPDDTRRILQAAAVLGREFSAGVLGEILSTGQESLENALTELQRRELVREIRPQPQQVFSFKHVLTQEAAYQSILLSSRRELHRLAAEAILSHTPNAAAEIAHHLLEARQAERALSFLIKAGDQSNLTHALEEAIGFFQRALALEASDDPAMLTAIYEGLGRALTSANRIPEALQVYQEMKAKAEDHNSIPMQVSALNKLASVTALNLGRFQEAESLLNKAEQLSHEHKDKSGIPEVNLLRCLMCTAQADFDNVVVYMDQVVEIGQELDNPDFIALGMEHVATSLVYLTRFEQAEERAHQALQVTRQIGDRMHEANLLSEVLPLIAFHQGDLQQAETYLQQGLQIAARINYLEGQALASYFLGELARWKGEYETALHYANAALKAALPLEEYLPFLLAPVLGSLGMIYLEISPQFHDKTLELHQQALRLLENPMAAMTGAKTWADLGECAIMTGDLPLADTVIAAGLNTPNTYSLIERPRHLAASAKLAGAQGDWERAVTLAAEARTHAEEHLLRQHYPLTALVQGQVYAGAGQVEPALEAFDTAQREASAFGMRPILWQAHLAAAGALSDLGRQPEAEQHRAAAGKILYEIANLFEDQELKQVYLSAHRQEIKPEQR
jgi:class 3 adenylate cyclase/tetratricopeptide (TPR) repeat protein